MVTATIETTASRIHFAFAYPFAIVVVVVIVVVCFLFYFLNRSSYVSGFAKKHLPQERKLKDLDDKYMEK